MKSWPLLLSPHDGLSLVETSRGTSQYTDIQEFLRQIRQLEKQQSENSPFRRLVRWLEPLLDFLVMYSPAVDIMVQYDVNPSAIVWGSLKVLVQLSVNCVNYYSFIDRAMLEVARILSTTARYDAMFERAPTVQTALRNLYFEVSTLVHKVHGLITKKPLRVLLKCMLRPIDAEFKSEIQRLQRKNETFKEEVTLTHRQRLEVHIEDQRRANDQIGQFVARYEQKPIRPSEQDCENDFHRSILTWLGQVQDFETFHNALKKRTPGTGLWLFDQPLFREWIQNPSQTSKSGILWVTGGPGTGKTVLSRTVIEHIKAQTSVAGSQQAALAFFYSGSASQSKAIPFDVCTSVLSQFLTQISEFPKVLIERYRISQHHGRSRISEADDVLSLFREVINALGPTFLVLDGLDELTNVTETVEWLSNAVQSSHSLRVIIFSRSVASTRKVLGRLPCICMDMDSVQQDINKFLALAVRTLPCDEGLQSCVFDELSRKSHGMFLFADLSIQTLRSAIDYEDLLSLLNSIPNGIHNMYDLILDRLSKESPTRRLLAQRVLNLVCTCIRPMTWSEMRIALSWDSAHQTFEAGREPFQEAIFELCCPLIQYQPQLDTFHLAHFTVYEYLCQTPQPLSSPLVGRVYVNQSDEHKRLAFMTLSCMAAHEESLPLNISVQSLSAYAIKYWCEHLSRSPFDEDLHARYAEFTSSPQTRSTWILRWLLLDERSFPLQHITKLLRSVQDWALRGRLENALMTPVFGDIGRALFDLDNIQSRSEVLTIPKAMRKISNFEKLISLRDLAREYSKAGSIDRGIELFESALENVESSEVGITPRSCWLLNSLGVLYDQQNRTQLARQTQYRALRIQESVLPSDHEDIILTINELGRIARHLGEHEEAEKLHRRALDVLLQTFPEDDLHVIWTKNTLGRALLKESRPIEALELHQQAHQVQARRLGENHPHTLWTLSDMARCYRAQDRLADAIDAQREVMERRKETLGVSNADTLWAINSLGLLYEEAGDTAVAKSLHTAALKDQRELLGEAHAHTRWSEETLAQLDRARYAASSSNNAPGISVD